MVPPPISHHVIQGRNSLPTQEISPRPPALVFLTATLSPPGGAVTRSDLAKRLDDYLRAFEFYLSLPQSHFDRVLFVDNSAGDVRPIEELARSTAHDKTVEIISFAGNDHPVEYGKAYGEFKLIDYGLTMSRLARKQDVLWKVTGRLRLTNITEIAMSLARPFDLACDLHNVPFVGTGRLRGSRNMDLRAFACSIQGYRGMFEGLWQQRARGFDAEFFYDVVKASLGGPFRIVPRFPLQPGFSGASGRHDRRYDSGLQAIKTDVRAIMRRALPWLWL
jgi:hypothetical protein